MRVNARKLTRIQVHARAHAGTSACTRASIGTRNKWYKLIADECRAPRSAHATNGINSLQTSVARLDRHTQQMV